jgi:phenylalanyl-tRNA synthetase alpha subunit
MAEKNKYSKILRAIAGLLDELSETQIDNILSGKGQLIYEPRSSSLLDKEKETKKLTNFEDIIKQLGDCKNREEAKAILSSIPNKETLTAIAKTQKIHVIKNDRREDIENKLIEFTIGAKLRTEAIHSLNLKGGSGNG